MFCPTLLVDLCKRCLPDTAHLDKRALIRVSYGGTHQLYLVARARIRYNYTWWGSALARQHLD